MYTYTPRTSPCALHTGSGRRKARQHRCTLSLVVPRAHSGSSPPTPSTSAQPLGEGEMERGDSGEEPPRTPERRQWFRRIGVGSIPKLFSIARFARTRGGWRREDGRRRRNARGYERTDLDLVGDALGLAVPLEAGGGNGNGGGGDGKGGGGGFNRFGHEDGWWHLRGFGALVSVLFFFCKLLVCWCSTMPTDSAGMCDLGFLFCCAMLAIVALFPSVAVLRPFLVEMIGVHIICEMAFYGAILPRWDHEFKMPWDMWTHHGATVVGASYLLWAGATQGAVFWWIGCQFIVTELTTFLPIAFKQANKQRGRVKGTKSIVLGTLFPVAFIGRTALSLTIVYNFMEALKYSAGPVPFWGIGLGSGLTISFLNSYWTWKIFKGTAKAMSKVKRKEGSSST
ncbi:hypothetical protein PPROV_000001700 [Pycnococcus provasolii]|uniref:TLC domain-containing protein n=1 Tax=Pycnococcus provasolii TaxID=41880 RepID=A0A830H6A9_9CHLO|nr:hypothetical protein PPROV_000001700 [Pycnococcus provasolii]